MNGATAYFISDLHLREDADPVNRPFFRFCASLESKKVRLFILGDLFDAWLGDDFLFKWTKTIQSLKRMSDLGCKLFFQHGNRDFLVGKEFAAQTGCSLLKEETIVSLHGKKVFLDHGEIFCINDPGSLSARAKSRNPDFQKEILKLPPEQRIALGEQFFAESKKHKSEQSEESMRASADELLRYLAKTNCDVLIYGHTHIAEHKQVLVRDRQREILNAGCRQPNGAFSYIKMNQQGIGLHKITAESDGL